LLDWFWNQAGGAHPIVFCDTDLDYTGEPKRLGPVDELLFAVSKLRFAGGWVDLSFWHMGHLIRTREAGPRLGDGGAGLSSVWPEAEIAN
jgi:hypothetical protein